MGTVIRDLHGWIQERTEQECKIYHLNSSAQQSVFRLPKQTTYKGAAPFESTLSAGKQQSERKCFLVSQPCMSQVYSFSQSTTDVEVELGRSISRGRHLITHSLSHISTPQYSVITVVSTSILSCISRLYTSVLNYISNIRIHFFVLTILSAYYTHDGHIYNQQTVTVAETKGRTYKLAFSQGRFVELQRTSVLGKQICGI